MINLTCPACGHRYPLDGIGESTSRIGGSNRMLTMREAAEYIGFSYSRFARHYRDDWRIPHYPVRVTAAGKPARVLFRERDLEAFLDRHREG